MSLKEKFLQHVTHSEVLSGSNQLHDSVTQVTWVFLASSGQPLQTRPGVNISLETHNAITGFTILVVAMPIKEVPDRNPEENFPPEISKVRDYFFLTKCEGVQILSESISVE